MGDAAGIDRADKGIAETRRDEREVGAAAVIVHLTVKQHVAVFFPERKIVGDHFRLPRRESRMADGYLRHRK